MRARRELELRQRRWAEAAGVAVDARGYVRERVANLRRELSCGAAADFARGSELEPGRHRPARMWALHSSAALVANVFDGWGAANAPLVAALGEQRQPAAIAFEEPIPTGVAGDPPTLDVALTLRSGRLIAVESKFTEWLQRRPRNKQAFKPKYFPPGRDLWAEHGLHACQGLARALQSGAERFKWLHAAQLLKHALGLARRGAPAALVYLYFDWPTRESAAHRAELERFAARVAGEIELRVLTYQALYAALARDSATDRAYLDYLRARYF
jgi:hypothetical protein